MKRQVNVKQELYKLSFPFNSSEDNAETREYRHAQKLINEELHTKKFSSAMKTFTQLLTMPDSGGQSQQSYESTTETINKVGFGLGKPINVSCQDVLDRIKILRNTTLQRLDSFLQADPENTDKLCIYLEHLLEKQAQSEGKS